MKRYGNSFECDAEKHRAKEWKRERDAGGFRCAHCKQFVVINDIMGTANRNHCNWCLWSKHVDTAKGNRQAICHGGMEPIGLTFKHEGYGKVGEVMLIHLCSQCPKISINRIARDDPENGVLDIFDRSLSTSDALKAQLDAAGIYLLCGADKEHLHAQLFGYGA